MIEINDKLFKTKKSAEDFIRTILYKYPLNSCLVGDDLTFICSLLEMHPNKEEKVGVGIKSIIVEKDTTFNKTTHFSIIRTDDSKIDFSLGKCLTPSLNEPIRLFHLSARRAIADQVISFRNKSFADAINNNGEIVCVISGVSVAKNTSNIDHAPPNTFHSIVSDFISLNNINVNTIEYIETPDGIGREFSDSNLKDNFSDYHRRVAKLRILSPWANLTQKRK